MDASKGVPACHDILLGMFRVLPSPDVAAAGCAARSETAELYQDPVTDESFPPARGLI